MSDVWVFGYGSLIWKPELAFRERRAASVHGWTRRFWQGSHDHRGVPEAPGRVVTLVPQDAARCHGVAYLIERSAIEASFAQLDYREKNGYERHEVRLEFRSGDSAPGVVYIAAHHNPAYLGPATMDEIARQVLDCAGPSGSNVEYALSLADALRELEVDDEHVFDLERRLK